MLGTTNRQVAVLYNKETTAPRYLVGVDVGVKTGFAIYDTKEKRLTEVSTFPLFEVIIWAYNLLDAGRSKEYFVFIENPSTFVPFKGQRREAIEARRQGAGSVKRSYSVLVEALDAFEMNYASTRLQGSLKKTSAKFFAEATGWKGKTSEHARDAAFLVFGRTGRQF